MKADEKNVYNSFFEAMVEKFDLTRPNDLMLLDNMCFDFIRLKRIQGVISREGDFTEITLRNGQKIKKATDASYLLNAVQSQFRQTMKELMLTRKEEVKKQLGLGGKDFSTLVSEIIDADYVEEGDNNRVRRVQKTSGQEGGGSKGADEESRVVYQQRDKPVQPSNDAIPKGMAGTTGETQTS